MCDYNAGMGAPWVPRRVNSAEIAELTFQLPRVAEAKEGRTSRTRHLESSRPPRIPADC